MFTLTCRSTRLADGRYRLQRHDSDVGGEAVLNEGLSTVWEMLLEYARAPHDQQCKWFLRMDRQLRSRLVALLASFEDSGYVELGRSENLRDGSGAPRIDKLHLEITHRCNFRCQACYLGDKLQHANGSGRDRELTAEEWSKVIEEAAQLGCMNATVTGGEPFLRSDIFTILEALDRSCILINVNTNASPITERIAKKLSELMVVSVSVSLYGYDRPSAENYCGNGPGYDAAMNGIRHLFRAGVPVVAKYFATRQNAAGFEKVSAELQPMGITPVRIGHSIHADIFAGKLTQIAINVSDPNLPRTTAIQETELPCHPTRSEVSIEPDGSIRACPKIGVYFGNAYHDGLASVVRKSEEMAKFRRFWLDYCDEEGFVKGAHRHITCPAAEMLMKSNGLLSFHQRWQRWKEEHDVHLHS